VVLFLGYANVDYVKSETNEEGMMTMILTSTAFTHNGEMPSLYTCDGRDISPPLAWKDVPDGAKSLVLIVDDPDAPDPKAPKIKIDMMGMPMAPAPKIITSEGIGIMLDSRNIAIKTPTSPRSATNFAILWLKKCSMT